MNQDYVILVDENDQEIGIEEKQQAHIDSKLHRAISVFIFNTKGEMLIHRRAAHKYHSPNLWTNATCSHPKPGEETIDAAHRRLQEEMGFDCELKFHSNIMYKLPFDNGLTEHEYDHIFTGTYEGVITPNPNEVSEYKYMKKDELINKINSSSSSYTEWFKLIVKSNFDF